MTDFPTIVPEGVIGKPGRPGANDRIVVASIGVGGMGQSHVPADVAALCDVDRGRMNTVAQKVVANEKRTVSTPPDLYTDYRQILERKDIDAVTIGTPDFWHGMMTVHACQAGKHVYSEKPTCNTLQEGRAMVDAARRYDRAVQIGAQGRSNPNAHAACQYVRNGMLGTVNRVEIWHPDNPTTTDTAEPMPVPPDLDWDMWLGPMQERPFHKRYHPGNFRWFMELGGGQIKDRGNHAISIVSWLMNHDEYKGLVTVEATGDPQPEGMYTVPRNMVVNWSFQNPDWTLTWRQGEVPESHLPWGATYYGDKDTLIVRAGDGGCDTEEKAMQYQPPAGGEVYLHPTAPGTETTERHRQNWYDCIRTGNLPVMDVAIGHATCSLCTLGNLAYTLGRKLTYDMGAERFLNDEEANNHIAATYRAPWHL